VAVGVEPILELAARPSVSTNGEHLSRPVSLGPGPETPLPEKT
jgi:hypothetical protein